MSILLIAPKGNNFGRNIGSWFSLGVSAQLVNYGSISINHAHISVAAFHFRRGRSSATFCRRIRCAAGLARCVCVYYVYIYMYIYIYIYTHTYTYTYRYIVYIYIYIYIYTHIRILLLIDWFVCLFICIYGWMANLLQANKMRGGLGGARSINILLLIIIIIITIITMITIVTILLLTYIYIYIYIHVYI